MAAYSFDFGAPGADDNAIVAAGAPENYIEFPSDHYFLTAVADTPQNANATKPDVIDVPHWALMMACAFAYHGELAHDLFALDAFVHATTMAYTLDNAHADGFFQDADGADRVWPTLAVFARDLGLFADKRRAEADATPYELYDGDFVDLSAPALVGPQYLIYNKLSISAMLVGGNMYPMLRFSWLMYPHGSTVDDSDDDGEQAITLRLLLQSAAVAFPALNAASSRLAVVALLSVDVPAELVPTGVGLSANVAYVALLTRWADVAQRKDVLEDRFALFLKHPATLAKWLRGSARPAHRARELLTALRGSDTPSDVAAYLALDELLASEYADYWNADRTPDENVAYLLTARRGKKARYAEALGGGAGSSAFAADTPAAGGVKESSDLAVALEALVASGAPSTVDAIELIYFSRSTDALRWLLGKGVSANALPAVISLHFKALPVAVDDYIVDSLVHDDTGAADPDLDDLSVATFLKAGSDPTSDAARIFYARLHAGCVARIDWEKDFVHPIMRTINPEDVCFTSMRAVYADTDRTAAHTKWVGRLLHAIGKGQDANNSLAAIHAYWAPFYAKCRASGASLAADGMDKVERLMSAVWVAAEKSMTSTLKLGTPWTDSLVSSDLRAFVQFEEVCAELSSVAKMAKYFGRTLAGMPAQPCGGPLPALAPPAADLANADTANAAADARRAATAAANKVAMEARISSTRAGDYLERVYTDGDWLGHTQDPVMVYSQTQCQAYFADLGFADQCVLVVTSVMPTKQQAWGFCGCNHALHAPQHALYDKYAELKVKDGMVPGMHFYTRERTTPRRARAKPGLLQLTGPTGGDAAGGKGGGRGGKGRGGGSPRGRGGAPFRRPPARP